MNKIITILRKEWAEVFKNRMVIFSVVFLPLIFGVIPLGILSSMGGAGGGAGVEQLPPQLQQMCKSTLSGGECMQYFIVSNFMIMFMMIPLIVPVNIAAYSIVGEKTTRSLEPLLATPITTGELLAGKNLAAVIPAVLATWAGFAIFGIGSFIITKGGELLSALFNPMWLLAVFVTGPLLALLSVNFCLMVSSRVNDPRAAEQLSAVIVIPVVGVFIGQISQLFYLNSTLVLIASVVLIFVDALMIYLATRLFQRETILTRWK